ncbi:MAG: LacI family transcriptional regulator protein [Xanthobacteraceae bacterium]|jgi:DNA-binding LacI/PurR family transcriptional regulator|nr:LacI family transcriptional regulator protein [Xanthobacteraceae bacterium]
MTGPPAERSRFVSAQEVADRAGVSRSAVSRSFTPGASVAEETRRKVMQAAEEFGYQVNDLARGLLAAKSRLVGIVATRPELGFRAHLAAALVRRLIRRGSVPVMIDTGSNEAEMSAAQRTLFGHRAEAIIILSGSPPASFIELARRNGQPLVLIGRSVPGVDSVLPDNAAAGRQAATLFAARGLRRLGYVGSSSGTPSTIERGAAFRAAAEAAGAHVVSVMAEAEHGGGHNAAARLFAATRPPEAVFCVNDPAAFGVMDFARSEAGLDVPGDVGIIGFDDVPEAGWPAYDLTTFRQDPQIMAEAAVDLLDRRQADPDRPAENLRIAVPLVVRRSFRPDPIPAPEGPIR